MIKQSTDTVLMIYPNHFGFNHQTESSNAFQINSETINVHEKATLEFEEVLSRLKEEGVNVLLFQDRRDVVCPDAVFPNNWLGIHPGDLIITYPMMAPNRQLEKRPDIINTLLELVPKRKHLDLSKYEKTEQYLEGTGSIVFDHLNKTAYAALSVRTSQTLANEVATSLGYKLACFNTTDENGCPVYHTNVVLSIGTDFVIISKDFIDEIDRDKILNELRSSGRTLIEIDKNQTKSFAANVLEVRNHLDEKIILISETALNSLNPFQIAALQKSGLLLPVSIPTIEQVGGGGVRCMIAEIF